MSTTATRPAGAGQRAQIKIRSRHIDVGGRVAEFEPDELHSLLRVYLVLVRKMRSQRRLAEIQLRRVDIETLAAHLELSEEVVVARLAGLMGATRSQRTAMLAAFASGAMLIALAGTAASPARAEAPSRGVGPRVGAEQVIDLTDVSDASITVSADALITWTGDLAVYDATEASTQGESASSMATPEFDPAFFGGQAAPKTERDAQPVPVVETPVAERPVVETPVAAPNTDVADDASDVGLVDGVEVAVGLAPMLPPPPSDAVPVAAPAPAVEGTPVSVESSTQTAEAETAQLAPMSDASVTMADVEGMDDEQASDVAVVDGVEVAVGVAPTLPVVPPAADGDAATEPDLADLDSDVETLASDVAVVAGVEVAVGLAPVPPTPAE